MTYQEAFAFGHSCLKAKKYDAASLIFETLLQDQSGDRRTKILLARSEAGRDHFEACHDLLQTVFEGENDPIAEDLHNVFVFYKMGMLSEAINELAEIVRSHPSLPTACLILGDAFAAAGKHDKAVACWKLAIKRDEEGGAVATAAKKQIQRVKRRTKRQAQKGARATARKMKDTN
jgi:predicted Zn-dependent protease